MLDFPFYLNCVDPGGTTGLALIRIEEEDFAIEEMESAPYDPNLGITPVVSLKRWRAAYSDVPHVLVYENFTFRPGRRIVDPSANSIIQEMKMWISGSTNAYAEVVAQEPVEAKRLAPDFVLDRLGLKLRGRGNRHINDALRHAVHYLAKARYSPVCERGWPRGDQTPN